MVHAAFFIALLHLAGASIYYNDETWLNYPCYENGDCPDDAICKKLIPGGCKKGYCLCRKKFKLSLSFTALMSAFTNKEKLIWSNGRCIPIRLIGDECNKLSMEDNKEEMWMPTTACIDGIVGCPAETDEAYFDVDTNEFGHSVCKRREKPGFEKGVEVAIGSTCRISPKDICLGGSVCQRVQGVYQCHCPEGQTKITQTRRRLIFDDEYLNHIVLHTYEECVGARYQITNMNHTCGVFSQSGIVRVCNATTPCQACPEGGYATCRSLASIAIASLLLIAINLAF